MKRFLFISLMVISTIFSYANKSTKGFTKFLSKEFIKVENCKVIKTYNSKDMTITFMEGPSTWKNNTKYALNRNSLYAQKLLSKNIC